MVQLSNDCTAFDGPLLRLEQALERIQALGLTQLKTETLPLDQAQKRIAAQDIFARLDNPPFDNSAVDGYAVKLTGKLSSSDQTQPQILEVIGQINAGQRAQAQLEQLVLQEGQAIAIMTGALLPQGADAVYMIEDCALVSEPQAGKAMRIRVPAGLKVGANCRFIGEDIARGSLLVRKGQRLSAVDLALLAQQGLTHVNVIARPRVLLLSSGDEVVSPQGDLGAQTAQTAQAQESVLAKGQIFDANQTLLQGFLTAWGFEVTAGAVMADKPEALSEALAQARAQQQGYDIIVSTGGASMGDKDFIKSALQSLGRLDSWRLAIKPGRPVIIGEIERALFLGLPGNPVAAFVTALLLVYPLKWLLAQLPAEPFEMQKIPADFEYKKKTGRREFVRARLRDNIQDAHRQTVAQKFPKEGAGMLSSLAWAQGLVVLDEDCVTVTRGQEIDFLPFHTIY